MTGLNLSELVKGLMVVVAIAMSLGKLPELKQWAIKEAFGTRARHHRVFRIQSRQPKSVASARNIEEMKRR